MPVDSLLPGLIPVETLGFSLNLMYIGLNGFRYRDEISSTAKKKLGSFGAFPENAKKTTWHKFLTRLSLLSEIGSDAHFGEVEDAKKRYKIARSEEAPGEVWISIYVKLFERHFDRVVSIVCASTCYLLVILGVAHATGVSSRFCEYFVVEWIQYSFYVGLFCAAVPVVFIALGKYMLSRSLHWINETLQNFSVQYKEKVVNVENPAL